MQTYGFDYVFALTIDKVNAILAANLAGVRMELDYATKDPDTGSDIVLNAVLSPWSIVPGGGNTLINMNIPISAGSLKLSGGAIKGDYDLAGVTVEVQISLGWLGAGDQQDLSGSGDRTRLVFAPTDASNKDTSGYVAVVQILDPQHKLDTMATGLLRAYTASALIAGRDQLKYIFADVDPASSAVGGWLQPKKWLYYYVELPDGRQALCFLSMLSDAAFPTQSAFDATALPRGQNAVILISQQQFFANVVLPGIQSAFPGAQFSLSSANDRCTIRNVGAVDLGKVSASSLTVTASDQGDGLGIAANGGGPLKFLFGLADLPNASYSWDLSTQNPLVFNNPTVSFQADPNPKTNHSEDVPWYDWALLATVGIVGVPGLISTIMDLVNGFSDQANAVGMDKINAEVARGLDGSVLNLATLVQWQKQDQSFSATGAGLAGAFYVNGNLG